MALLKTGAIVLNRSRLGDTDLLAVFMTRSRGKIKGVARGARKLKSRYAASLEPFSLVELILFMKKETDLARINHCDLLASRRSLRESPEKMAAAAHICSLVSGLTAEGDADEALFSTLNETLERFDAGGVERTLLMICRARIIALSGYAPTLDGCVRCRRKPVSARLFFEPTAGGLLCDACIEPASDTLYPLPRAAAAALERGQRYPTERLGRIKLSAPDVGAMEAVLSAYEARLLGRSFGGGHIAPAFR